MEKDFTLEEIQKFYPKHKITDTGHHFLVKDYYQYGDFKLSAKVRKSLPLFKNGNPILPTQPFCITDTRFSVAIGTGADCLHVQAWFGNFYSANKRAEAYFAFGDITQAQHMLAVAYWDQTQNWFRRGVDGDILRARQAIAFSKNQCDNGAGQDIWILNISEAAIPELWRECIYQRQIIIENSDILLKTTTSFPTSQTAKANNVPA